MYLKKKKNCLCPESSSFVFTMGPVFSPVSFATFSLVQRRGFHVLLGFHIKAIRILCFKEFS